MRPLHFSWPIKARFDGIHFKEGTSFGVCHFMIL